MSKTFVPKIVSHLFNGNEDEVVVEVEGVKYIADPTDPTKPKLGDDQKPIPFVDKKVDVKIEDLTKAELADLAKVNPHVAKLLDDQKKREEADTKAEQDRKKKEEDDAKEKGNWQQLAETRGNELDTTKKTLAQKEEMLGKYVGMTENILKGLLNTIPKENIALIPADFSPRQKVEYIFANADRLGAKVNAAGGKIEKNETEIAGTEEAKLSARITELTAKANNRTATNSELTELQEVGSKLTQLRREAAAKK